MTNRRSLIFCRVDGNLPGSEVKKRLYIKYYKKKIFKKNINKTNVRGNIILKGLKLWGKYFLKLVACLGIILMTC